jgi:catechol 2,3-dioxygenase-like lactoylglutathione lyase family enzyme
MTIQRMDHVGIVVDDLAAAKAFFLDLGLTVVGEQPVGGDWVDQVSRLQARGTEAIIVMLAEEFGG